MKSLKGCLVSVKGKGEYMGVVMDERGSKCTVAWLIPSSYYPENFIGDVRLDSVTEEDSAVLMGWGISDPDTYQGAKLVYETHKKMLDRRSLYPNLLEPKFLSECRQRVDRYRTLSEKDRADCFMSVMRSQRVDPIDYRHFPDIQAIYGYPKLNV